METVPRGSTLLMHLLFQRGKSPDPCFSHSGKPNTCLYLRVQDEERKKEKKNEKEINYLSSINIKETCKTQTGVTRLLSPNHLIIAPGNTLLSLTSVQQNCLRWTTHVTCVCLLSGTLSSILTSSSHPNGKLCEDTLLGR